MEVSKNWVIYGANGFTGQLVAALAKERGLTPLLCGRNASKLSQTSKKLGLPYQVVKLDDYARLTALLENSFALVNCAGPFRFTHGVLVKACLQTQTHYLDITGELQVILNIYAQNQRALEAKIALIPAMGFDVVPSDCLAVHTAAQVAEPFHLALAIIPPGPTSAGTLNTILDWLPFRTTGYLREGKFVEAPLFERSLSLELPRRKVTVGSVALADLVSAPRSTGIANITTYIAVEESMLRSAKLFYPALKKAMSFTPLRKLTQSVIAQTVKGPSPEQRRSAQSWLWAEVANAKGEKKACALKSIEPYRLTAECCVRAIEKLQQKTGIAGALTPAQAFGKDFILELPGTHFFDL